MITYEIEPIGNGLDGLWYTSSFDTLEEAEKAAADMADVYGVDIKVYKLISVARVKTQTEGV